MRGKFVMVISVLVLFPCAYKNTRKTVSIPQGIYKGTFIRSSPLARYAASNVTIKFTRNAFEGQSDKLNYPAICMGTFKVNGSKIEFGNKCFWTSDFDWTYVLKEKFGYSLIDNRLEMTKTLGDNTDHYSLTLQ
jgi:hypothetical protein